jgi:hypothetical protein
MGTGNETWARRIGLAVGLAAAAATVLAGRLPAGDGTLGAEVVVAAHPSGELGVRPSGPFLRGVDLRPGDEARGEVEVVNQTGLPLEVRVRGLPSSTQLDGLLHVAIEAGPDPLFRGTLGELRGWSPDALRLDPGEARTLSVRAWLPGSVEGGYEGRVEQVGLEFGPSPAGGAS